MTPLTDHQRAALDRYESLAAEHPELFRPSRPIVRDREVLEGYAAEHGVVLGVAAETPWVLFIVDLVESVHHPLYIYSRMVQQGQLKGGTNVVVLATIADSALGGLGDIVLVEQDRHATGHTELAIPRGFGEPGYDGITNALRELQQETGFLGERPEPLGELVIDSGASDARVTFYHVRVTGHGPASPEIGERIHAVHTMSPERLRAAILAGEITDSFTVEALALAGWRETRPNQEG